MINTFFDTSLEFLKGVGPIKSKLLFKELGLKTYRDLIYFFPFRYTDRSKYLNINQIQSVNIDVQLKGKISQIEIIGSGRKKRLIFKFEDSTGSIELVFFKRISWIKKFIKKDQIYVVFGKPNSFNSKFSIIHPEIELYEKLKNLPQQSFCPVYHSTELLRKNNLNSRGILKLMNELFIKSKKLIEEENLSYNIIKKNNLLKRSEAVFNIHFPENENLLSRAIYRMKYEELFFLQLSILKNKSINHKNKSFKFREIGKHFNSFFYDSLLFELTGAQKKVMKEIRKDLLSGFQMNRLVQGDVGSGKTIIAIMSFMICADNGFQSCLMVPTEVLAFQHYNSLTSLCSNSNLNIALLTGSTKLSERKEILEKLDNGNINIIVGTHSLIQPNIKFKNLGLVVIDEQHKFGVAQRASLSQKGINSPHILILTATPIPRTLAMTFYGDLDVSVIDEMPPGRKQIKTVHKFDKDDDAILSFLLDKIKQGEQAYVIFPLIEESEKLDYKNLISGFNKLQNYFSQHNISLSMLHGKMKSDEKNEQIERFVQNKSKIMISTTVIEVGIDVKNASIMVIENAERFGLSQLHQLRGRVGRGNLQSYCILKTPYKLTHDAKYRMNILVESSDGFEISEADLRLRGPGDMLGTRQSGMLNLKIANLVKDGNILTIARHDAQNILDEDFNLIDIQNKSINRYFAKNLHQKIKWMKIS